jgi:hypothetical protein
LGTLLAREPREHSVRVDSRGVSIDGTLHPYSSLQSFWVEEEDDPRLFVATNGIVSPHLTLPLGERSRAGAVRTILRKHIREEEQGPHIGEQVADFFGL